MAVLAAAKGDAAAEPLPEICAPELLVCTLVFEFAEAAICPNAVDCAAAVHAPINPITNNESVRFMRNPSCGPIKIA
jgi:hypothetical protein